MTTSRKMARRLAAQGTSSDQVRQGVSYTRYSTLEQGSTAEQRSINEELAADLDIEIVRPFQDEGLSRSLSDRPGLLDMFGYLEAHPSVRYLIVNELERLTAGIAQRQQVISLCKRLNITIVTEDIGAIDPHDDDKMHEADQRSVASQGELLKGRRRTRRSLRSRVRSGRSVAMKPCYGVRAVPLVTPEGVQLPSGAAMIDSSGKRINSGKIELHPEEYPHLVQMFEWSAEGASVHAIARRLVEAGVPTKSGKKIWPPSSVGNILDNPFYKGEMTWGLTEVRRDEHGRKYTVVRPEGDPGRIDMPSPLGAIIEPDLWERALRKREDLAAYYRSGERRRRPRQVLDGRIYCLRCGHKMFGRNQATGAAKKKGVVYWGYVCRSSSDQSFKPRDGYENCCTTSHSMSARLILEALASWESPDVKITAARGGSGEGLRLSVQREEERIAKARAGIEVAQDLALEGDISKEKMRAKVAVHLETIRQAENRITALGTGGGEVAIEPIRAAVGDTFTKLVHLLTDEEIPLSVKVEALDDFGLEKIYVDNPLLRLQLRD